MTLRIVTEPAVEPVTVAEVMQWGRIDSSNAEPAPGAISGAMALGASQSDLGSADLLSGYLAAVYIWNAVKSDADILAVSQMLATRYGITLS